MILRLNCSTAALTIPQKVLSIWKLVELKMLEFSDRTRTGILILTSAADSLWDALDLFYDLDGKQPIMLETLLLWLRWSKWQSAGLGKLGIGDLHPGEALLFFTWATVAAKWWCQDYLAFRRYEFEKPLIRFLSFPSVNKESNTPVTDIYNLTEGFYL